MRKSDGFAHALPGVMVFGCFCLGAALQTLAMKRSELSVNYIVVLGLEAALALLLSIAWLGEGMSPRRNSRALASSWRGSWLCGGKSRGKPRRQKTAARTRAHPGRTDAGRSAPQGHAVGRSGHSASARSLFRRCRTPSRCLPLIDESAVHGAAMVRRRALSMAETASDRPGPGPIDRQTFAKPLPSSARPPEARGPARARTTPPRAGCAAGWRTATK